MARRRRRETNDERNRRWRAELETDPRVKTHGWEEDDAAAKAQLPLFDQAKRSEAEA